MQRIRKQVDHFQQQLSGLSLGQRLLTGVLVATMFATVVWWIHYASTDQAVALFEQPLSAEQATEVKEALSMNGIACDLMGGQVYVSAEQAQAALMLLDGEQLLPSQTTDPFGDALDGGSLLEPQRTHEARMRIATVRKLQKVLSDLPGVRTADLVLDTTYRQRLGGQELPTASVNITTEGSADAMAIADAAAWLVAGSVTGLRPSNVTVVVDAARVAVQDMPAESHALARFEQVMVRKIRAGLPDIPKLSVVVNVGGIEPSRAEVAAPPTGMPAGEIDSIMAALKGMGGPDADLAGSELKPSPASQVEDLLLEVSEPVRGPTVASCALTVPVSWLISQWQARHGNELFPGQAELDEYERLRLAELQQQVSMTLGGLTPERIAITVDNDVTLPGTLPPATTAEEDRAGISALTRDYGREVAVGALAAVSLLLAATMLKKGAPTAVAAGTFAAGPESFSSSNGGLHEAEVMEGCDIEPMVSDASRTLERVQALVKSDPAQAAALVQRWLNAA